MIGNAPTTLAYYISFDFVLLFNIPSRFHFFTLRYASLITVALCYLVLGYTAPSLNLILRSYPYLIS